MTTSKTGLMIRHDNKLVKVFESKFDRSVGDLLTIDGVKYRVCHLEPNKYYAAAFLATFGREHVFSFFKF